MLRNSSEYQFFIGCRQNSELLPKFHVSLRSCRSVLPTSNFRHDATFQIKKKKRNINLAKILNSFPVAHIQSVNFPLPLLLTSHSSRLPLAYLYLKDERAPLANLQSNQFSVLRVVKTCIVPVTAFPSPSAPPALASPFILLLLLSSSHIIIIIIIIIILLLHGE